MLKMIKGCRIHDPSVLNEGYAYTEFGFVANVNADKIQILIESFIKLHNDMCFLVLEVPTNARDETDETLHKDVYYLDGLTPNRAVEFLNVFAEWLIHDGLSSFGFGIHSGDNEIVADKYNVVKIFTRDILKYNGFFESHDLHRIPELKTAWNYFTDETPGESFLYTHQGKNIYELIGYLKQYGLYFAERREV